VWDGSLWIGGLWCKLVDSNNLLLKSILFVAFRTKIHHVKWKQTGPGTSASRRLGFMCQWLIIAEKCRDFKWWMNKILLLYRIHPSRIDKPKWLTMYEKNANHFKFSRKNVKVMIGNRKEDSLDDSDRFRSQISSANVKFRILSRSQNTLCYGVSWKGIPKGGHVRIN